MAQVVKRLPCKREDLSLDPTPCRKPELVMHTCHLELGSRDRRTLAALWSASLTHLVKFQNERLSQTKGGTAHRLSSDFHWMSTHV